MAAHEQITLRMSDGYAVHARWWPTGSRGAVLYLHGIQSHGGWFEGSAAHLAQRGFAVLLPDRRGSGRNQRNVAWRGLRRRLLQDVDAHIDWLCETKQVRKVHLVGVSWGGKLAVAGYLRQPARIASLSLVAPGLIPRIDVAVGQKLRIALAAIVQPGRQFDIPLSEPELFTATPERQRFIADDPHRLRRTGAGFLAASRLMDIAKVRLPHAPPCPLHLFLAQHDQIIDNARTRSWAHELHWENGHVTVYEGAHHTLEFEPDPEPFFRDLADWLESVKS